jgi:hypothetical protein
MAQYTGVDELDGLFKNVYGEDGPVDLVPEIGMIYKEKKLRDTEKIGSQYIMNVIVANSHGFTYNSTSNTAYSLNNHIAMTTQDAAISAAEIVLRDAIAYRAASRSAGGKKQAFKDATELVVKNMYDSHVKRLEIDMWYGGAPTAIDVGGGIGATSSSANVDTTHTAITFSEASWADGIWAGLENAQIEFRVGTNLVSSAADAIFTVQKVDNENRKVTVTGTTGGISTLDTDIASTSQNCFFYGSYGEQMTGLHQILGNTGTLFGISASTYGLWKANSVDCGSAQLTMQKVLKGAAKCYGRGLVGKAKLFVSPVTWANLASDLASLRRYDGSYKRGKAENGVESLTYYAQNGEIEIVGYTLVKRGFAYLLPMDRIHRIGSSDVTFNTPGMGGKIFTQLASNAGFELRNYSDSAIFVDSPAKACLFTGIVNV